MATIAIQKSGALAPISDRIEESRSKKPPILKAASEPMTIAELVTSAMVIKARLKVQGKASSTTSSAGRAFRRLSPKSKCSTSQT